MIHHGVDLSHNNFNRIHNRYQKKNLFLSLTFLGPLYTYEKVIEKSDLYHY